MRLIICHVARIRSDCLTLSWLTKYKFAPDSRRPHSHMYGGTSDHQRSNAVQVSLGKRYIALWSPEINNLKSYQARTRKQPTNITARCRDISQSRSSQDQGRRWDDATALSKRFSNYSLKHVRRSESSCLTFFSCLHGWLLKQQLGVRHQFQRTNFYTDTIDHTEHV